jgi:hypothetical protein
MTESLKTPEGEPESTVSMGDCHVKCWRVADDTIIVCDFYRDELLAKSTAKLPTNLDQEQARNFAQTRCGVFYMFVDRAVRARLNQIHQSLGIGFTFGGI